jgi:glutamate carboxypeptidase
MAAAQLAQRHCDEHLGRYLARLRALVEIDSGPDDGRGRDDVAQLLAEWAAAAGLSTDLVETPAGLVLRAVTPGELPGRVVFLGHHDTVFPHGTAAARPFSVAGTMAYGPGTADMKGGLLVALAAQEALLAGNRPAPSVELHSVPDEEMRTVAFDTIGSLRGADAALVFECGRANGNLVAGRKTGAWMRLAVNGRAAHAGTEPERGRSAVLGLCHEVLRCSALHDTRPGVTVTAGTIAGGTIPNVVPADAEAIFDVRAETSEDLRWAMAEMAAFGTYDGLSMTLEDAGSWPGIEPTPAGERLVRAAVELSAALGLQIGAQTTGGMSDGCWTAAAGIPTLDGLGPVGGADHSPDEYIDLTSITSRCAIAAGLAVAIGNGLVSGCGR